jgi:hypothetical protein
MSIVDKLKKMHPAYWVLGLGGVALGIDYYVERNKSVASSVYRKLSSGTPGARDGQSFLQQRTVLQTRLPRQSPPVYYSAFPPGHPHRHRYHWMLERPLFGRGYRHEWIGRGLHGHLGHHGRW